MEILAIDGSSSGPGRTATALRAVLEGADEAGAKTKLISLAELPSGGIAEVLAAIAAADAVAFGSPVYRGSHSALLANLLESVPRGMWSGEGEAVLQGKAVAILATGADLHHFLALDGLRNVLSGFFSAYVLPPGLYVPGDGFDQGALVEGYVESARQLGAALLAFAPLLEAEPRLRSMGPQA